MPKKSIAALTSLTAVAGGVAAWGVLVERTNFRLRREILPILDAGSDPIKVLHLSDLHMAPWHTSAISWIRELAALEPDLVIGTGDFLGHRDGLSALTEALMPLAGIPGVVTHGSNDRVAPRWKNPLAYLLGPSVPGPHQNELLDFAGLSRLYSETLGWRDIDNGATRMRINNSTLDFVGVGDAHDHLDELGSLPSLLEQLREGEDSSQERAHHSITTVGVTHAPYQRVLDAFVTNGCDAIFAGHTHGGQVCLPGGRALTTNCDLPTAQASGLGLWAHATRSSYLEVSAGLGTSIYAPVRLFCPPEAVLVTLVGDDISYA